MGAPLRVDTVAVERIDLEWLLRRWEELSEELAQLDAYSPSGAVLDGENEDDRRTVARLRHALGMVPA